LDEPLVKAGPRVQGLVSQIMMVSISHLESLMDDLMDPRDFRDEQVMWYVEDWLIDLTPGAWPDPGNYGNIVDLHRSTDPALVAL
jgi:hypothetical protein